MEPMDESIFPPTRVNPTVNVVRNTLRQIPHNRSFSSLFIPVGILLGLTCILFLTVPFSSATTLTVDDDSPADFTTIQDAVNASAPGDTIRIFAGTYREHVFANHSLTFIGNGSGRDDPSDLPSMTIINGGGEDVGLFLENQSFAVSGIAVTGGGCCNGAGLKVGFGEAVLSDILVFDNEMTGLIGYSSRFEISNSSFRNNSVGLMWSVTHESILRDSYFMENGIATTMDSASDSQIVNVTFEGNPGFGIRMDRSERTMIRNSSITGSQYGITQELGGSSTIMDSVITGARRGIFFAEPVQDTTITGCSIFGNSKYGLYSTNGLQNPVNATNNWWGNDTGPYHPLLHPGGTGDPVSTGVVFYPWNGTIFLEPRVLVTSSPSNLTVSGEVLLEGTAEDPDTSGNGSGSEVTVWVSVNGGNWSHIVGVVPWRFVWNTTTLANGSYDVSIRAFDGEHYSAVSTFTFDVVNGGDGTGGDGQGNGDDLLDDEDECDDGGYIFIWMMAGIIMIVLASVAGYLYFRQQGH